VCLRYSEDGHYGVADELLDHATVTFHGIARDIEVAGQHVSETLRIEALSECRRTADVAEDNGHRLPLLPDDIGCVERRRARVAETRSGRVPLAAPCADRHAQRLERHLGGYKSQGRRFESFTAH
jgi:hypothetical protein